MVDLYGGFMRSPNYPMIGLDAAIKKAGDIYASNARNVIDRQTIAKRLGYGGINGGSSSMISALTKYGLLDSKGNGTFCISDLAMRILYPNPNNADDERNAIEEAAFNPKIFSEIREKWPCERPNNAELEAFLTEKNFQKLALPWIIKYYHDIIDKISLREPVQKLSRSGSGLSIDEKHFSFRFDCEIRSVRDVDRLSQVLNALRIAFEAA